MPRPIAKLSRALSHLRWLYMPAGLFALIAVGMHAGAAAAHDGFVVALDWLDGHADRAAASALLAVGGLVRAEPQTVDGWIAGAAGLVDLREREIAASWLAVALELAADLGLALPALGYREREARERARESAKEARLAELVARRLEADRPGLHPRPLPRAGSARLLLRAVLGDPTLLRLALPLAAAAAVVAGACRVAVEARTVAFAGFSRWTEPPLAEELSRCLAILALGAVLASLGGRAVLQALGWAHRRAELDRASRRRAPGRRLRGWLRVALCAPVAAAALAAAPLLSFFR